MWGDKRPRSRKFYAIVGPISSKHDSGAGSRAYMRHQTLAHRSARVIEQLYAASGDQPDVRSAAVLAVPIMASHLQMAEQLESRNASQVKSPAALMASAPKPLPRLAHDIPVGKVGPIERRCDTPWQAGEIGASGSLTEGGPP
jgi:hypothetical protein